MILWNLTKFQLNQAEKMEIKIVWMSFNFVRFHEILFQTEVSAFHIGILKTKKFLKKIFLAAVSK